MASLRWHPGDTGGQRHSAEPCPTRRRRRFPCRARPATGTRRR